MASPAGSVISSAAHHVAHSNDKGIAISESLTYAFATTVFQNDVYKFPGNDIRDSKIFIGEGATSTVFRSFVTPSFGRVQKQAAAIKQKRRRGSSFDLDVSLESWIQAAYLDIRIMSHRSFEKAQNVVQALGYFWEIVESDGFRRLSPCLVLPLALKELPTLEHFFQDLMKNRLSASDDLKRSIFHDVAQGLHELHSCGVVHGDLKPENILLFDEPGSRIKFRAKLSDFSHAIVMADHGGRKGRDLPRYTGTRPFLIPEVRTWDEEFARTGKWTCCSVSMPNYYACDVFSLGHILRTVFADGKSFLRTVKEKVRQAETTTGKSLVDEHIDQLLTKPSACLYEAKIALVCLGDISMQTLNTLGAILDICLQHDPERRGTARQVLDTMEQMSPNTVQGRMYERPDETQI